MESKKINQLATELAPVLSDLTIIGDPTTGISRKITLSQMASLFTGTVEEYPNLASFPLVGTADTIYIALDTNIIYRWNTGTNAYVELSPNIVTSLVFNDANGFDGTINLVGSTATLTITTALTQGSVPFIGTSGALTQDNANLFFDDTNNRLGINTNAPTTALDVFGSGIIGRLNGTSTNNAFLGFASAGSNKWSIGNVQSDHRFRIFSETNTSELITILQTGEFGIGIANPTTKIHIDGGASALIANLDADVSIAKSISFRSDNSNRINLEVSGTESGSNAGANFFIRRYSDAGSLIDTPLTITRSTGAITFSSNNNIFTGGTDSNFNTYPIAIANNKNLVFGSPAAAQPARMWSGGIGADASENIFLGAYNNLSFGTGTSLTTRLTISSTGAATFTGSIEGTIINSTSNAFRFSGNTALSLVTLNSQSVVKINAAGFWGVQLVGANDKGIVIDNIGNVGIGTPTPVAFGTTNLDVNAGSGGAAYIVARNSSNAETIELAMDGGVGYLSTKSNHPLRIRTNDASRIIITSIASGGWFKAANDGNFINTNGNYHEITSNRSNDNIVYLSNTASSSPYGPYIWFVNSAPNNTTNYFLSMSDSVNTKAEIYANGTFGSRTGTYGSIISDEKYKTEIESAKSQWNDIKNLRVVNFKYKEDVELEGENALKQIGFIAQEVEKVSPNLVYIAGKKDSDETWKSVKTSIIEIKAIKALQEAMGKIEILEEKVKQLESKLA